MALPDSSRLEALKYFLGYSRENLLIFCDWQVDEYVSQLEGSRSDRDKKYISDLYEPCAKLEDQFNRFIVSESKAFVLVGDSGVGKTCWACHTAKDFLAKGYPSLFYRGLHLNDIFGAVSEDLNWQLSPNFNPVEGAKRLFDIFKQQTILFFIDGLDEIKSINPIDIVDNFLKRTKRMDVKIVATCKSADWPRFLHDQSGVQTILSESVYEIENRKGYHVSEIEEPEFRKMVERYRQFYSFQGRIERRLLDDAKRQPFLLKVMFEVASTNNLQRITYDTEQLYDEYLNIACSRTQKPDLIKSILSKIAASLYENDTDYVDVGVLKKDLSLSALEELPEDLFRFNILEKRDQDRFSYIGFYYQKLRDYLIVIYDLKLQTKTMDEFLAFIRSRAVDGMHVAIIAFYYSVTTIDEHKRLLDGPLFSDAQAYLQKYEEILDGHFPQLKSAFDPKTTGSIGFVGSIDVATCSMLSYGFRSIDTDDKVVLLPATPEIAPYERGFIEGARTMRSRRPSLWGRGMDITTEIVWDEIGPGLDGIVRDGLLNESENKDLLVESVLASYITYLSAVRDEGPLRTANDILPISFDRMLKKRAVQ